MSAPERIWAWDDTSRYAEEQGIREGSWDDQVPPPDNALQQTEYIRKDASDAAISAARAETFREMARDLRNRAAEPRRKGPSIRALVAAAMAAEKRAAEAQP